MSDNKNKLIGWAIQICIPIASALIAVAWAVHATEIKTAEAEAKIQRLEIRQDSIRDKLAEITAIMSVNTSRLDGIKSDLDWIRTKMQSDGH